MPAALRAAHTASSDRGAVGSSAWMKRWMRCFTAWEDTCPSVRAGAVKKLRRGTTRPLNSTDLFCTVRLTVDTLTPMPWASCCMVRGFRSPPWRK